MIYTDPLWYVVVVIVGHGLAAYRLNAPDEIAARRLALTRGIRECGACTELKITHIEEVAA